MSDSNAAWEALNFLLKDYLDRQLPDDPAANYIRDLCSRKTRPAPPAAEVEAAPSLPSPRAAKKARTSRSRSEAIKAAWAERKARSLAQQSEQPLSRNGSPALVAQEEAA